MELRILVFHKYPIPLQLLSSFHLALSDWFLIDADDPSRFTRQCNDNTKMLAPIFVE
jgi:hypothetical protein